LLTSLHNNNIIEMIKGSSSGGESSSGDRKRQATSAPLDDEDPLRPSSSQEHDASTVASMIPINLIAALILPYVQDRSTWNSVCFANKELREAGKRMRPPWPNTTLNVEDGVVRALAFSPCKSFLACGSEGLKKHDLVHVWDRQGEQTQLEGHTRAIACLQYSLDGRYLASGSSDGMVRLWRTMASESAAHSSLSDESRNRGTPPAQFDIILLGHMSDITALAFSPTDSNLLASGCRAGEIKLWDVISQVCIHAFDPQLGKIGTILFSPEDNIQCYVVTRVGSMIRIVRNNRMEFAATILEEPSLGKYPIAAFSPCGTFFAACSYPATRGSKGELALFDLRTMAKTQSVVLSDGSNLGGLAMSPDGTTLAATYRYGGTRLIECHDLTIRKYVDTEQRSDDEPMGIWPVVFDPTSRFFAAVRSDGRVDLRSI
jgi:WD40 repeat protein